MLTTILMLFSFSVLSVYGEDPVVQIQNGKVKGEIMVTPNNRSFYAFRGIPYAKPPLGELRFQPPQKPDNWEGVLDSDAKDRWCIQINSTLLPNESEDCLYIHVYTPQLPTKDQNVSLPVMYAIHGGAFIIGTSTMEQLGPHYLMDYDIIVVTVAYRLGFLGFLSTADLNCPGNNGLKDQQFGLRWVQENIRSFGGDPKRVTIFGESAGGASVGYHLLSKNSEGIYIGAIQDSGTPLANWAFQRNPKGLAYNFAKKINSTITEDNTSTSELMEIFKTLDVRRIKKACVEIFGNGMTGFYGTANSIVSGNTFVATVEPEHDGAFLTELPYQKFLAGNFSTVPMFLGVNSEECLIVASDPRVEKKIKQYDENTEYYVPGDMHITDLEKRRMLGLKIREMYDPSGPLHKNMGLFIRYFSDDTFVRPEIKQAELASKYNDVFFYEFGYSGELAGKRHFDIPGAGKVHHAEEMSYLFHQPTAVDVNTCSEEDRVTMRRMLTLWTNFVKYQNPTPEKTELLQDVIWPKIASFEKMPYLLINNTLEINYNFKQEMMEAYQKLYDTYAIPPLDTY